MSHQQPPLLGRKSSTPWDRLRPVKQDPLESVGFVSKGDNRLLNSKTQESYYHKITARYMQFCAQNSKNLDDAFASLSLNESAPVLSQARSAPQTIIHSSDVRPAAAACSTKTATATKLPSGVGQSISNPAEELSIILTALRKLREGILATSSTAHSPVFSQRVHVFNIRLAILALHTESYHASLRFLLSMLHSREHPLPQTELREMTCYLILDTALRLGDINSAHKIRVRAGKAFGFSDKNVNTILRAVVMNDWPLFWQVRNRVDGYVRAIMYWKLESIRKSTLKAIGRSYLKCNIDWILMSTTGSELTWEELVEKEDVGWLRDGNTAIIRKPKLKT